MNITTEELKTLYERARDYAKAKEPKLLLSFFKLCPDGTIVVEPFYDEKYTIIITAENLAEDLDEVRKTREEKIRQEKAESEERAKNERRKQYEELKKEFEQEGNL